MLPASFRTVRAGPAPPKSVDGPVDSGTDPLRIGHGLIAQLQNGITAEDKNLVEMEKYSQGAEVGQERRNRGRTYRIFRPA